MTFADYMLMLVAAIAYAGLGAVILRGRDLVHNFLVGILLVAGIASSLAWTLPYAIAPMMRGFVLIGLVCALGLGWRAWRGGWRPHGPSLVGYGVAIVLAGVWFFDWHYAFHTSQEEELYFAPLVEMFLADYKGPLRSALYYPTPLSALHIAPSAVWGALCALMPKVTMLTGYEARLFLGALVFGHVGYGLYGKLGRPWWQFVPVALAALYLMDGEIRWSFGTSSQVFYLVMVEIAALAVLADGGDDNKEDDKVVGRTALVLAISLMMLKTSVIFVPFALAAYVWLRQPGNRFDGAVVLMTLIVAAQMVTTLAQPRPYPGADIGFSLGNPFGPKAVMTYHWEFALGRVEGMRNLGLLAVPLAVALFWLKYYALPAAAIRRVGSGYLVRALQVMLLAALVSWLVVRNGQQGTTHSLWAAVFATAPGLVLLIFVALQDRAWVWRGVLAAGLVVLVGLGHVPWRLGSDFGGVSLAQLQSQPVEQLLQKQDGEPAIRRGIRALMLGQRLMRDGGEIGQAGVMNSFMVLEGHKP